MARPHWVYLTGLNKKYTYFIWETITASCVHTYNPNTWEVEAEGLWISGHTWATVAQSKIAWSTEYIVKPYLTKQKVKNKTKKEEEEEEQENEDMKRRTRRIKRRKRRRRKPLQMDDCCAQCLLGGFGVLVGENPNGLGPPQKSFAKYWTTFPEEETHSESGCSWSQPRLLGSLLPGAGEASHLSVWVKDREQARIEHLNRQSAVGMVVWTPFNMLTVPPNSRSAFKICIPLSDKGWEPG